MKKWHQKMSEPRRLHTGDSSPPHCLKLFGGRKGLYIFDILHLCMKSSAYRFDRVGVVYVVHGMGKEKPQLATLYLIRIYVIMSSYSSRPRNLLCSSCIHWNDTTKLMAPAVTVLTHHEDDWPIKKHINVTKITPLQDTIMFQRWMTPIILR